MIGYQVAGKTRILNWRRGEKVRGDIHFPDRFEVPASHAPKLNLISKCPPILDQGPIGSCTAHSAAGAWGYLELKEMRAKDPSAAQRFGNDFAIPSRPFIYYAERDLEGTTSQDAGALIRDAVRVLVQTGAPQEAVLPYYDAHGHVIMANIFNRPSPAVYELAAKHKASLFVRCDTHGQIKSALEKDVLVLAGFDVYESFMSPQTMKTGLAPMPNTRKERLMGGHAIDLCGWDDTASEPFYYMRNSWGVEVGMPKAPGYFTLPQRMLDANLMADCWAVFK